MGGQCSYRPAWVETVLAFVVFTVGLVGVAALVTALLPSGLIRALDDFVIAPWIFGGLAAGATHWVLDGVIGDSAAVVAGIAVGVIVAAFTIFLARMDTADDEGADDLRARARAREATY